MPKYRVTWRNKSVETYEIYADTPEDAEERYAQGKLIAAHYDGEVEGVEKARGHYEVECGDGG